MASQYYVKNNTPLPIHAATQWAGIIQRYENNIKPGETGIIQAEETGFQDFVVVTGLPGFEFSHDNDWKVVLGGIAAFGAALAAIAGVCLIPFTGGASAAIVAGAVVAVGGLTTSELSTSR